MSLISVQELARRLDDPDLVIADCRWALNVPDHGREAYRSGHIPGAVFADLETDLSGPTGAGRHPLPDPEMFDATLGSWGVSSDSTVVVYDDAGGSIAARLWWMLTDQGHTDTLVLDGGIDAWVAAGRNLEFGEPQTLEHGPAGVATRPWNGVVAISAVASRPAGTVVIDARAPERFRGESEPIDPKPGHIPGAINMPTSENLVDGQFKSGEELRVLYADSGVEASTDTIVHCGSGVTACHDIFAMELAGLPRPALYVGSWSDWSSTNQPISVGNSAVPSTGEISGSKPSVLFLCVHNAGRSQMAAGWMRYLGQDRVNVFSGGSEPADSINQTAVEAMAEAGIDIADETPQPWSDDEVRAADVVVSMGCGDACPVLPGKRYVDWELDDPAGRPIEDVRTIRDDIKGRVLQLMRELQVDARS